MMDEVLSVLRGVRNGSYYGTKVRAPHGTGLLAKVCVWWWRWG